jgi:hypothetical protein
MFPGFFIGTVFLFWLVRSVIWGHRYHPYAYGYRRPRGPFGAPIGLWGDDPWPDHGRRWRDDEPEFRRPSSFDPAPATDRMEDALERFLASLRNGLRATPAQEKALAGAIARLGEATAGSRERMNQARDSVARAVRAGAFDELAFEDASHDLDEAVRAMRGAIHEALIDVHDVLDEKQRAMLASLIESRRV